MESDDEQEQGPSKPSAPAGRSSARGSKRGQAADEAIDVDELLERDANKAQKHHEGTCAAGNVASAGDEDLGSKFGAQAAPSEFGARAGPATRSRTASNQASPLAAPAELPDRKRAQSCPPSPHQGAAAGRQRTPSWRSVEAQQQSAEAAAPRVSSARRRTGNSPPKSRRFALDEEGDKEGSVCSEGEEFEDAVEGASACGSQGNDDEGNDDDDDDDSRDESDAPLPSHTGRPSRGAPELQKAPSWHMSRPPWATQEGRSYYGSASDYAAHDIGKKLFEKTTATSLGNPSAWQQLAEKMRLAFPLYKTDWETLRDNLWCGNKKKNERRPSLMDAYRGKFATTHANESGEGEAETDMEKNCFKLIELEQAVKRAEDKAKAEADKKAEAEKGREADVESAFRNRSGKPKGTPGASAAAGADAPRGQRSKSNPPPNSREASSGGGTSAGASSIPPKKSKSKSVYDTLIHTKIPKGMSEPSEEVMLAIGCLDDYESNLWDTAKSMEVTEMEESDAAELMLKHKWRGLTMVGFEPFHRHEPGYAKNVTGQLGDWAQHHMTYMTWLSTLSREHMAAMAKACGIQDKRAGTGDGGGGDRDDMAALGGSITAASEAQKEAQLARVAAQERMQSEKHAHQLKVLAMQNEAAAAAASAAAAAQQAMIESLTRKTPAQRIAELEGMKSLLTAQEYADKRAAILASL